MLTRRTVITGALVVSAGFRAIARAQNPPAPAPDGNAPLRTILQLQRRNIVVNGKTASVYGIRQPNGTFGITTDVGKPFRVRVENGIDEPSLIHWHGLTPPWQQDGCLAFPDLRSHREAMPITTSRCASAAPYGCTRARGCRSSC